MTTADFYASSNLKGNPFRPSAVATDDPRAGIWVGFEPQKKLLERLLSRVRSDQVGLTSFVLMYGDYGAGKSHALLWSRNWVSETHAGLGYYVPTLKRDKGKLLLANSLREDLVDRGSLPADLVKYHAWLSKMVLEALQTEAPGTPHETALKRLFPTSNLYSVAKDIYDTRADEQTIREYLANGFSSEHETVILFSALVNLLTAEIGVKTPERFIQAVYLFLDEMDDLARQPAKDSLQTNDTLRHLYDLCPNAFGLFVAATSELNTLQHLFTEYVLSRVTRRIEFPYLDQAAAKDFVRQILDNSRVDTGDERRMGFFPLNEEAVSLIISQLRQITPRDIVKTMQHVLEEIRIANLDPAQGAITPEKLEEHDVLGIIFDN